MAKKSVDVLEYIENMGALLRQQPELFGFMVERQIQARLLPRVAGSRQALEPKLWALLIFCLDGHEAGVPPLDDDAFTRAEQAAREGTGSSGAGAAAYPEAARSVIATLSSLREVGVYPPPRL